MGTHSRCPSRPGTWFGVALCAVLMQTENNGLGKNGNDEYCTLTVKTPGDCSKLLRKLHKTAENYRRSVGVFIWLVLDIGIS